MANENANYVITIARCCGSSGRTIGKLLAKELSINYYDKDIIRLASEDSGINISLFGKAEENVKHGLFKKHNKIFGKSMASPKSDGFVSNDNLFNYQAKIIRDIAGRESCIIVGRCADFVLKNEVKNLIRVFISTDKERSIAHMIEKYGYSNAEAEEAIEKTNKSRGDYYKYCTGNTWDKTENYDICLNTSDISVEDCVKLIKEYAKIKGYID